MRPLLLDGKRLAKEVLQALHQKIVALPSTARPPKLAILQVEGDAASSIYVKHKRLIAEKIGISTDHLLFPATVSFETLLDQLLSFNQNSSIHGILLQLPLPPHLPAEKLLAAISPEKDVDGLSPQNLGCLMQKHPSLIPCTPHGIMRLLDYYQQSVAGKEVVILNASSLVGRPLAMLLLTAGATVTLCHTKTRNLETHLARADILISATGKPHVIPVEALKQDVIIIDVGVHRHPTLGLIGDVDFNKASQYASAITPVPGGVGVMTVAMLMENVMRVYERIEKL